MILRKGQEEIVGFVVVVVLIAVVALVFLSFSLRGDVQTRENVGLSYLVESVAEYTTSCSLYVAPDYASIGELYRACYQHTLCSDGVDSCLVLNQTLLPLINQSLRVGVDTPLRGYRITINALESVTGGERRLVPILTHLEGNCSTGTQRGASDFRASGQAEIRATITTCS